VLKQPFYSGTIIHPEIHLPIHHFRIWSILCLIYEPNGALMSPPH
jgi:hypothetical protein